MGGIEGTKRKYLADSGFDDVAVFDDPALDNAIVGITPDRRAVYDYDLLVDGLVQHDNFSEAAAREWIECNVYSALPYDRAPPVIIISIDKL